MAGYLLDYSFIGLLCPLRGRYLPCGLYWLDSPILLLVACICLYCYYYYWPGFFPIIIDPTPHCCVVLCGFTWLAYCGRWPVPKPWRPIYILPLQHGRIIVCVVYWLALCGPLAHLWPLLVALYLRLLLWPMWLAGVIGQPCIVPSFGWLTPLCHLACIITLLLDWLLRYLLYYWLLIIGLVYFVIIDLRYYSYTHVVLLTYYYYNLL